MNSFLREAIHQGEVLHEFLDYYTQQEPTPLTEVVRFFKEKRFHQVLLAGMGSSYYAAFSVADYLVQNCVPCIVLNAFEVSRYQIGLVTPDTLLVVISQSGKTKEVLELVEKAKKITSVVAMVNKEDSLLALQTNFHLWIKAGVETQITNKSYLCTLALLNLLAAKLVADPQDKTIPVLYELSDWIDNYLKTIEQHLPVMADFVQGITNIDLLGNGPSFAAALQAGLNYREGPKIISTASNTADYAHGWDKSARPGYVGVLHSPTFYDDSVDARMMQSLLNKGAKVILITSSEVKSTGSLFVVRHPAVPERLATLPQIIITTSLMGWLMGARSDRE